MYKKSAGFTLVEVVVVIALLGIIAAIAIPRLTGYKQLVEEKICLSNRKTVERLYIAFLLENNQTDILFIEFMMENFDVICPLDGDISYEELNVRCSVHKKTSDSPEEPPGDEVPWL